MDDARDSAMKARQQGKQIFRCDTFGDETFWSDTLRLHEVIRSAVDPTASTGLPGKAGEETARLHGPPLAMIYAPCLSMSKPEKLQRTAARPVTPQPQVQHQQVRVQQYQGNVPPPAMLAEFDQTVPGMGARLLKLAEEESQHRASCGRGGRRTEPSTQALAALMGSMMGDTALLPCNSHKT